MNTVKFEKGNTLMIAHRGVSGLEKENTNAAFIAAGNRSYFGIETDVHKTADGKYVIIHDDDTVRVAVDNIAVEKSTFAVLRNVLLCDIDGKKGRTDLRIPSLEEYISICKKYEKIAVLELKNSFLKEDVFEILSVIKNMGYRENTIIISFDLNNLKYVREYDYNQPAQFLTDQFSKNLINILIENNLDLDIYYKELDKKKIHKLHDAGIKINCWTCDSAKDGKLLSSWGVDYITSDILE